MTHHQSEFSWRTSSYSVDRGGQCVEIGWKKSSYSANGNPKCVEAGPALTTPLYYAVRDSQNPALGHLTLPPAEWSAFLTATRHDAV